MIKIMGIVSIMCGTIGYSFLYITTKRQYIKLLNNLVMLEQMLAGKISYEKYTLMESLEQISPCLEGGLKAATDNACNTYKNNPGVDFIECITENFEAFLTADGINTEDRKSFLAVFNNLKFKDCGMQIKIIESNEKVLSKRAADMERQLQEKRRVVMALGILSGLFMIIVLI